MRVVYVAGPITKGNTSFNVQDAVVAADRALAAGWAPFVPQLSVLWEMISAFRRTHDDWMRIDFAILAKCDALVRIPGESVGADKEVAFARERGIPVYIGIDALEAADAL